MRGGAKHRRGSLTDGPRRRARRRSADAVSAQSPHEPDCGTYRSGGARPQPRRTPPPDGDGVDLQGGDRARDPRRRERLRGSGVGLMLIAEDGLTLRYVASSDASLAPSSSLTSSRARGPASMRTSATPRADGRLAVRDALARAPALPERSADPRVVGLPTRLGTPVGTLNLYRETPQAGTRARSPRSRPTTACWKRASAARWSSASTARSSISCRSRSTPRDHRAGHRLADGPRRHRQPGAFTSCGRRATRAGASAPWPRKSSAATDERLTRPRTSAARSSTSSRADRRPRPGAPAGPRHPLDDHGPARVLLHEGLDQRECEQQPGHEGEDRERRRPALSALSGRMSSAEIAHPYGGAGEVRADGQRQQRPGQERADEERQVEAHPGPADAAELIEDAGGQARRREQRRALPEIAAVGRPVSVTSSSSAAAPARPMRVVSARIMWAALPRSRVQARCRPGRCRARAGRPADRWRVASAARRRPPGAGMARTTCAPQPAQSRHRSWRLLGHDLFCLHADDPDPTL